MAKFIRSFIKSEPTTANITNKTMLYVINQR